MEVMSKAMAMLAGQDATSIEVPEAAMVTLVTRE